MMIIVIRMDIRFFPFDLNGYMANPQNKKPSNDDPYFGYMNVLDTNTH